MTKDKFRFEVVSSIENFILMDVKKILIKFLQDLDEMYKSKGYIPTLELLLHDLEELPRIDFDRIDIETKAEEEKEAVNERSSKIEMNWDEHKEHYAGCAMCEPE